MSEDENSLMVITIDNKQRYSFQAATTFNQTCNLSFLLAATQLKAKKQQE
jgi:hypothetical protein